MLSKSYSLLEAQTTPRLLFQTPTTVLPSKLKTREFPVVPLNCTELPRGVLFFRGQRCIIRTSAEYL